MHLSDIISLLRAPGPVQPSFYNLELVAAEYLQSHHQNDPLLSIDLFNPDIMTRLDDLLSGLACINPANPSEDTGAKQNDSGFLFPVRKNHSPEAAYPIALSFGMIHSYLLGTVSNPTLLPLLQPPLHQLAMTVATCKPGFLAPFQFFNSPVMDLIALCAVVLQKECNLDDRTLSSVDHRTLSAAVSALTGLCVGVNSISTILFALSGLLSTCGFPLPVHKANLPAEFCLGDNLKPFHVAPLPGAFLVLAPTSLVTIKKKLLSAGSGGEPSRLESVSPLGTLPHQRIVRHVRPSVSEGDVWTRIGSCGIDGDGCLSLTAVLRWDLNSVELFASNYSDSTFERRKELRLSDLFSEPCGCYSTGDNSLPTFLSDASPFPDAVSVLAYPPTSPDASFFLLCFRWWPARWQGSPDVFCGTRIYAVHISLNGPILVSSPYPVLAVKGNSWAFFGASGSLNVLEVLPVSSQFQTSDVAEIACIMTNFIMTLTLDSFSQFGQAEISILQSSYVLLQSSTPVLQRLCVTSRAPLPAPPSTCPFLHISSRVTPFSEDAAMKESSEKCPLRYLKGVWVFDKMLDRESVASSPHALDLQLIPTEKWIISDSSIALQNASGSILAEDVHVSWHRQRPDGVRVIRDLRFTINGSKRLLTVPVYSNVLLRPLEFTIKYAGLAPLARFVSDSGPVLASPPVPIGQLHPLWSSLYGYSAHQCGDLIGLTACGRLLACGTICSSDIFPESDTWSSELLSSSWRPLTMFPEYVACVAITSDAGGCIAAAAPQSHCSPPHDKLFFLRSAAHSQVFTSVIRVPDDVAKFYDGDAKDSEDSGPGNRSVRSLSLDGDTAAVITDCGELLVFAHSGGFCSPNRNCSHMFLPTADATSVVLTRNSSASTFCGSISIFTRSDGSCWLLNTSLTGSDDTFPLCYKSLDTELGTLYCLRSAGMSTTAHRLASSDMSIVSVYADLGHVIAVDADGNPWYWNISDEEIWGDPGGEASIAVMSIRVVITGPTRINFLSSACSLISHASICCDTIALRCINGDVFVLNSAELLAREVVARDVDGILLCRYLPSEASDGEVLATDSSLSLVTFTCDRTPPEAYLETLQFARLPVDAFLSRYVDTLKVVRTNATNGSIEIGSYQIITPWTSMPHTMVHEIRDGIILLQPAVVDYAYPTAWATLHGGELQFNHLPLMQITSFDKRPLLDFHSLVDSEFFHVSLVSYGYCCATDLSTWIYVSGDGHKAVVDVLYTSESEFLSRSVNTSSSIPTWLSAASVTPTTLQIVDSLRGLEFALAEGYNNRPMYADATALTNFLLAILIIGLHDTGAPDCSGDLTNNRPEALEAMLETLALLFPSKCLVEDLQIGFVLDLLDRAIVVLSTGDPRGDRVNHHLPLNEGSSADGLCGAASPCDANCSPSTSSGTDTSSKTSFHAQLFTARLLCILCLRLVVAWCVKCKKADSNVHVFHQIQYPSWAPQPLVYADVLIRLNHLLSICLDLPGVVDAACIAYASAFLLMYPTWRLRVGCLLLLIEQVIKGPLSPSYACDCRRLACILENLSLYPVEAAIILVPVGMRPELRVSSFLKEDSPLSRIAAALDTRDLLPTFYHRFPNPSGMLGELEDALISRLESRVHLCNDHIGQTWPSLADVSSCFLLVRLLSLFPLLSTESSRNYEEAVLRHIAALYYLTVQELLKQLYTSADAVLQQNPQEFHTVQDDWQSVTHLSDSTLDYSHLPAKTKNGDRVSFILDAPIRLMALRFSPPPSQLDFQDESPARGTISLYSDSHQVCLETFSAHDVAHQTSMIHVFRKTIEVDPSKVYSIVIMYDDDSMQLPAACSISSSKIQMGTDGISFRFWSDTNTSQEHESSSLGCLTTLYYVPFSPRVPSSKDLNSMARHTGTLSSLLSNTTMAAHSGTYSGCGGNPSGLALPLGLNVCSSQCVNCGRGTHWSCCSDPDGTTTFCIPSSKPRSMSRKRPLHPLVGFDINSMHELFINDLHPDSQLRCELSRLLSIVDAGIFETLALVQKLPCDPISSNTNPFFTILLGRVAPVAVTALSSIVLRMPSFSSLYYDAVQNLCTALDSLIPPRSVSAPPSDVVAHGNGVISCIPGSPCDNPADSSPVSVPFDMEMHGVAVIESEHAYPRTTPKTWAIRFPRPVCAVSIRFDPRSELNPSDWVTISMGPLAKTVTSKKKQSPVLYFGGSSESPPYTRHTLKSLMSKGAKGSPHWAIDPVMLPGRCFRITLHVAPGNEIMSASSFWGFRLICVAIPETEPLHVPMPLLPQYAVMNRLLNTCATVLTLLLRTSPFIDPQENASWQRSALLRDAPASFEGIGVTYFSPSRQPAVVTPAFLPLPISFQLARPQVKVSGLRVIADGGYGWAVIDTKCKAGILQWQLRIVHERAADQHSVVGVSYDSTELSIAEAPHKNSKLFCLRLFNGAFYHASTERKLPTPVKGLCDGDILNFRLEVSRGFGGSSVGTLLLAVDRNPSSDVGEDDNPSPHLSFEPPALDESFRVIGSDIPVGNGLCPIIGFYGGGAVFRVTGLWADSECIQASSLTPLVPLKDKTLHASIPLFDMGIEPPVSDVLNHRLFAGGPMFMIAAGSSEAFIGDVLRALRRCSTGEQHSLYPLPKRHITFLYHLSSFALQPDPSSASENIPFSRLCIPLICDERHLKSELLDEHQPDARRLLVWLVYSCPAIASTCHIHSGNVVLSCKLRLVIGIFAALLWQFGTLDDVISASASLRDDVKMFCTGGSGTCTTPSKANEDRDFFGSPRQSCSRTPPKGIPLFSSRIPEEQGLHDASPSFLSDNCQLCPGSASPRSSVVPGEQRVAFFALVPSSCSRNLLVLKSLFDSLAATVTELFSASPTHLVFSRIALLLSFAPTNEALERSLSQLSDTAWGSSSDATTANPPTEAHKSSLGSLDILWKDLCSLSGFNQVSLPAVISLSDFLDDSLSDTVCGVISFITNGSAPISDTVSSGGKSHVSATLDEASTIEGIEVGRLGNTAAWSTTSTVMRSVNQPSMYASRDMSALEIYSSAYRSVMQTTMATNILTRLAGLISSIRGGWSREIFLSLGVLIFSALSGDDGSGCFSLHYGFLVAARLQRAMHALLDTALAIWSDSSQAPTLRRLALQVWHQCPCLLEQVAMAGTKVFDLLLKEMSGNCPVYVKPTTPYVVTSAARNKNFSFVVSSNLSRRTALLDGLLNTFWESTNATPSIEIRRVPLDQPPIPILDVSILVDPQGDNAIRRFGVYSKLCSPQYLVSDFNGHALHANTLHWLSAGDYSTRWSSADPLLTTGQQLLLRIFASSDSMQVRIYGICVSVEVPMDKEGWEPIFIAESTELFRKLADVVFTSFKQRMCAENTSISSESITSLFCRRLLQGPLVAISASSSDGTFSGAWTSMQRDVIEVLARDLNNTMYSPNQAQKLLELVTLIYDLSGDDGVPIGHNISLIKSLLRLCSVPVVSLRCTVVSLLERVLPRMDSAQLDDMVSRFVSDELYGESLLQDCLSAAKSDNDCLSFKLDRSRLAPSCAIIAFLLQCSVPVSCNLHCVAASRVFTKEGKTPTTPIPTTTRTSVSMADRELSSCVRDLLVSLHGKNEACDNSDMADAVSSSSHRESFIKNELFPVLLWPRVKRSWHVSLTTYIRAYLWALPGRIVRVLDANLNCLTPQEFSDSFASSPYFRLLGGVMMFLYDVYGQQANADFRGTDIVLNTWLQVPAEVGSVSLVLCQNHDDGSTVADLYCSVCQKSFCRTCSDVLHLPKGMASHGRESLNRSGGDRALAFEGPLKIQLRPNRLQLSFDLSWCRIDALFSLPNSSDSSLKVVPTITMPIKRIPLARNSVVASVCGLCRFCEVPVNQTDRMCSTPFGFVCSAEDCRKRSDEFCGALLPCSHFCCGTRPSLAQSCVDISDKHLDCLDCSEDGGNSFCLICHAEPLRNAPCVSLSCGHVFHSHCISRVVSAKWPGLHISWGFLTCPLCRRSMLEGSFTPPVYPATLSELRELRTDHERRALLRLQYDKLENHDLVTDPKSSYYGKPGLYALEKVYAYYLCFKCSKPYYGGQLDCEEARRDVDPADLENLVCPGCQPVSAAATCSKHGTDFVSWKCRYCCSIAVFWCFGTTRFCQRCHEEHSLMRRLQNEGALPPCPAKPGGVATVGPCPLGISHPPTGEEFALGCGACRQAETEM